MTSTTSERNAAEAAVTAGNSASSPPAWHPDPIGRFRLRYWDGSAWTASVVHGEQVGIDRGWADTRAATADPATAVTTPVAAAPSTIEPGLADRHAAPNIATGPDYPPDPPVEAATTIPAPRTGPDDPSRDDAGDTGPSTRFDISPAAVMGPRAGRAAPAAPPVQVPLDATMPGTGPSPMQPEPGVAAMVAPGANRLATVPETRKETMAAAATGVLGSVRRVVTGWRVAAVLAVIAVAAIAVTPLAWKSADRSYDAQEAWEERAEEWQIRAGDHADERDEAIALIGQSRARNRTLTEEIADLELQIEDLAAVNASLTDENQLMRDALASLGYQVAP